MSIKSRFTRINGTISAIRIAIPAAIRQNAIAIIHHPIAGISAIAIIASIGIGSYQIARFMIEIIARSIT